jgi:hypothetical protein
MTQPTVRRLLTTGACVLILAGAPSVVAGQSVVDSWPGLDTGGLQRIYVLDDRGTESSGTLLALSADSLLMLVDGAERRVLRSQVMRMQKRDSLRNGTIIGAIAGVALGLVSARIADCTGDAQGGSCPAARGTLLAVSGGIYSAAGAGVDALIRGRSTIYEAPPAGVRVPQAAARHLSSDRATARELWRMGVSW